MAVEMLVGLSVIDDERYDTYRAGMRPILKRYGGEFGVDVRVAEVLKPGTGGRINRMFTIRFPDDDTLEAFFSDEQYLAVKNRHFEASVESTSILATYEPR